MLAVVFGKTYYEEIEFLWVYIKKAREFQKNIYFCFIDYTKAFDCVDHNKLWKILKEMGMGPDHLTCLLRNLYAGRIRSDQIRSVAQSCPTLCDPMNRRTPGFPVHHQLPEFTQTHVHQVSDAIQPSHPLSSPSPLAPNPSQHQSLFQWISSSHEVAIGLEFQL